MDQISIPEEILIKAQASATDISVAADQLGQLAFLAGGNEMMYAAAKEVKRLEYGGMNILEAMREVYWKISTRRF